MVKLALRVACSYEDYVERYCATPWAGATIARSRLTSIRWVLMVPAVPTHLVAYISSHSLSILANLLTVNSAIPPNLMTGLRKHLPISSSILPRWCQKNYFPNCIYMPAILYSILHTHLHNGRANKSVLKQKHWREGTFTPCNQISLMNLDSSYWLMT